MRKKQTMTSELPAGTAIAVVWLPDELQPLMWSFPTEEQALLFQADIVAKEPDAQVFVGTRPE